MLKLHNIQNYFAKLILNLILNLKDGKTLFLNIVIIVKV